MSATTTVVTGGTEPRDVAPVRRGFDWGQPFVYLVALVIAAMGLFALSAYSADRRRKEIGIRRAMGASPDAIVGLLLWQFLLPVLTACAVGLGLGYGVMRHWLDQFASRTDLPLWLFAAVTGAVVLVAMAVMSAQVLRAAQSRVVDALRYE